MKYGKTPQIITNMFIVVMTLICAALPAAAKSAQEIRANKSAEIPVCSRSYGALSVLEPEAGRNWWTDEKLPSPSVLIKVYVRKSRCFDLVDRGAGFQAGQAERDLAASGDLRRQSNVGKGQIRAADYAMTPELASQNRNAGGNKIGGIVGGIIGGKVGAIASGIDIKKKTADVVLSVTDLRSSEMVAITEGSYKKTDIGFNAAGALWGSSGIGGAGVGGYANTEIGQVVALAYLNAYIDMIIQFSELPDNAAANNELQAVEVIKPARMLANPDGSGEAVRSLDIGMLLYPTGNKINLMWEVEDELGNKGWVNSTMFQLAR